MSETDRRALGRRQFLSGAGLAAAGAAAGAAVGAAAVETKAGEGGSGAALVQYPGARLANVGELKVNEPKDVAYPDRDALGVLVKLGRPCPGGVGPDGDIVAFSSLCPHRGYPLRYEPSDQTLTCPGHYSRFDCEKGGQQVWGHATQNLPQYRLRVDAAGDIYAESVDELLYGRVSNVL
jgi:arsenite oxidase small subunit